MKALQFSQPDNTGARAVSLNGNLIGTVCGTIPDDVATASPGLQSWSTNKRDVYIFAVQNKYTSPALIELRAERAARTLYSESVPFTFATGCYKGVEELCFITVPRDADGVQLVYDLAEFYGQESVLHLTGDRRALLETPFGDLIADLGRLVGTTEKHARRQDAWTFANGAYYICVK